MKPIKTKQKGFTIIELLVIISIIGLLSTLVILKLSNVRENARLNKALHFSSQIQYAMGIDALAYYTFDDGTAKDFSDYGNDGTIVGATSVDGLPELKKALSFNGVNNYVRIDNNFIINPTSLTISAWIKKEAGGGAWYCAMHHATAATVGGSSFWLGVSSTGYLSATIGANSGAPGTYNAGTTTTLAVNGQWYHLVASWNGLVVKVYLDGQYNKQYNLATYNTLDTPVRFGAADDGLNYKFSGSIDEVGIYNSALTLAQIQQLYAKGLPSHSVVMK